MLPLRLGVHGAHGAKTDRWRDGRRGGSIEPGQLRSIDPGEGILSGKAWLQRAIHLEREGRPMHFEAFGDTHAHPYNVLF